MRSGPAPFSTAARGPAVNRRAAAARRSSQTSRPQRLRLRLARDPPGRPMSAAPAYGEDKGGSAGPGEPEYGHDPASGGIFSSDYKR